MRSIQSALSADARKSQGKCTKTFCLFKLHKILKLIVHKQQYVKMDSHNEIVALRAENPHLSRFPCTGFCAADDPGGGSRGPRSQALSPLALAGSHWRRASVSRARPVPGRSWPNRGARNRLPWAFFRALSDGLDPVADAISLGGDHEERAIDPAQGSRSYACPRAAGEYWRPPGRGRAERGGASAGRAR